MKTISILLTLVVLTFSAVAVSAQCNPSSEGHIRCGYYNEGYDDGVSDARSNRSEQYTRYRNKYERQYENNYRSGYEAGFASVRPSGPRWTSSQRSAYDSGYNIGQSDRRQGNTNRGAERAGGGFDFAIAQYFQQGYIDGYANRPRTYDVVINPGPTYPPSGGGANGTATWAGRVDARANIVIRGNDMRAQDMTGSGLQVREQNMYGVLPRRVAAVSVQKREGRGDVRVIQQPNRSNNFTAIIQIDDPRGGADDYRLDISWTGGVIVEEPYQRGGVVWRGRVDQTVNIIINGNDVESRDMSGTGLSNVRFDINGYLANRPGSVTARKRNGRGTVTIIQQPSRSNDYTAIVQVFDPGGGADNYEVEIDW